MGLKEVIDKSNITQVELSKKANINRGTLTRIFNDGLETAKLETIIKICKVLNCLLDDIFPDIHMVSDKSKQHNIYIAENEKCIGYSFEEVSKILDKIQLEYLGSILKNCIYNQDIKPKEFLISEILKSEHFNKSSKEFNINIDDMVNQVNTLTEHQVYSIIRRTKDSF